MNKLTRVRKFLWREFKPYLPYIVAIGGVFTFALVQSFFPAQVDSALSQITMLLGDLSP